MDIFGGYSFSAGSRDLEVRAGWRDSRKRVG